MQKFWNWARADNTSTRTLYLYGTIAEESWFADDVTPALFREELLSDTDDVLIKINSPGGDCLAAAEIYSMLKDYPGKVRIEIDGLAASAASVIAMAGDEVYMSPVSMLMIHNPMTIALGEEKDMDKAKAMLKEVKESIINAYELKSHLTRKEIGKLMDDETWMNAKKAKELGFIDGILGDAPSEALMFTNKASHKANPITNLHTLNANELLDRLSVVEKHLQGGFYE